MRHQIPSPAGSRLSHSSAPTLALLAALLAPAAALGQAGPAGAPLDGGSTTPPPATAPAAPPPAGDRIRYRVVPLVTGEAVTTSLAVVPVSERDGRPLLGEALYRALGRPDLAAAYQARAVRRGVIAGLGVAVATGGLVYAATRPGPDVSMPVDEFQRAGDAQAAAQERGLLVALLGSAVTIAGLLIDPNPVGEAELHRLIDAHNASAPPGAGAGSPGATAPGAPGPTLSLGAALLPGGGLASLALAF